MHNRGYILWKRCARYIIVQYIKISFLESILEDNYLSYLLYNLLLLTCVSNKKLRILRIAKKKVIMFHTKVVRFFFHISKY